MQMLHKQKNSDVSSELLYYNHMFFIYFTFRFCDR